MTACSKCLTQLAPGAAFCSYCGEEVPVAGADLPLLTAVTHASRLISQGDVDRAIAMLLPHAILDEPSPLATFALGAAYLQRGRYDDALLLLAGSVQDDPVNARAHAYLAMAYLHTYQPTEARESMNEALRLAPEDFVVNLKYGELLARLGYFHEAIAAVQRALEVESPDAATLDFARRLLLFARQKAPNTFTRPVHPFPRFAWLARLLRRKKHDSGLDTSASLTCS